MTDTYFTGDSAIIEVIRNLQAQGKLSYTALSNDWVIKFWRGGDTHYINGYALDLNSQASGAIATDKVATYQLLTEAQVPAVPHILLTSPTTPEPDKTLLDGLFERYGQLVLKPTHGSRGRDVVKCANAMSVRILMHAPRVPSWSASPFLNIQSETRLVVRDGQVCLAYEKQNPPVIKGLKMFNINLGATPKCLGAGELDADMSELAVRAMKEIGLRLGAVDIVCTSDNQLQVLEINSGFSLDHYASFAPENHREVTAFYEQTIESLFQ